MSNSHDPMAEEKFKSPDLLQRRYQLSPYPLTTIVICKRSIKASSPCVSICPFCVFLSPPPSLRISPQTHPLPQSIPIPIPIPTLSTPPLYRPHSKHPIPTPAHRAQLLHHLSPRIIRTQPCPVVQSHG